MFTHLKYALTLVLFLLFGGMVHAAPPTDLVGSWSCKVDGSPASIISFNLGGTLSANLATATVSSNHGEWLRTGLSTFISKDLAFIFGSTGAAELIQTTDASITMSDNDNLDATLSITVTDLSGTVVNSDTILTSCIRIQV